jgi:sugar lactone lactonase YvrE
MGNNSQGLNTPRGIYVSQIDEALYVCDAYNLRAQRFDFGSRIGVTVAGGNGIGWNLTQINQIWNIFVDNSRNVYVSDRNRNRTVKWAPNATQGTLVTSSNPPWGLTFDQYGNVYTSIYDWHIVLRNNNKTIAGIYTVNGSTPTQLNGPRGIFFDKNTSSLFVCDALNHRIQKYQLNNSVGITVAGGNGPGLNPNQLNQPTAVWVSSNTGLIYIADTTNNRIQRWKMNDTQGVTLVGNGTAGVLSTMLNTPVGIALDANDTFLYVSEQGNNRVQRFTLPV